MVNYYVILGIAHTASIAQIKAAFKRKAIEYHPDKHQGSKVAEEKFKQINEAYQTLSDFNKKLVYDARLLHYIQSNTPPPPPRPTTEQRKPYTPEDTSRQGKYYPSEPAPKKESNFQYYVIGFTIFFIIATGTLMGGFFMNKIAAKQHLEQALLLYETQNYTRAAKEIEQALHFDPTSAEVYMAKGRILVAVGRPDNALPAFNLGVHYADTDHKVQYARERDQCKEAVSHTQTPSQP